MSYQGHYNRAAILEWTVCLIYIFYVASFVMDFLPAIHSKHHRFPAVTEHQAAERGEPINGENMTGGPVYGESYSNGSYASTQPMQQTGQYYPPPAGVPHDPIAPSRNF